MNRRFLIPLVLLLLVTTAGCDFVGDVLEFGGWLLLIFVVVLALVAWAVYAAFFD